MGAEEAPWKALRPVRAALCRDQSRGLCFGAGYGLMLSHNILVSFSTLAVPVWVQAVMLLAALILFGGCILRQRFLELRDAGVIGCVVILGVLSAQRTGKLDVIYFAAMLFLCRYGEERAFLKADLIVRVAVLVLLLYLSGFDVIVNTVFRKYSRQENVGYAYGSGFNNPNSMGMMLFLICVDALLLLEPGGRGQIMAVALCLLLGSLTLVLAGTRTAAVLTGAALVLYVLWDNGLFRGGPWSRWGPWAAGAVAAGSFLACYGYRAGWTMAELLNGLVTDRLVHLNAFMDRYPATLLGSRVTYLSSAQARELNQTVTVCDNIYVYLLHNLGLLPFLGWLALMTRTARDLLRRGRLLVWLMLCLMLVYGFMENTMANVMFFPFVFFCSRAMFPKEGAYHEA